MRLLCFGPRPYKFITFGVTDVTKPYEYIKCWAMVVTKPYEYIRFGAMVVTKPYEFTTFGAMDVTTSCEGLGPRVSPNLYILGKQPQTQSLEPAPLRT